jgi:MFS family permease
VRSPRGVRPLRHRGFRRLAGGQLASNLGDAFYAVALPWYVLADHGSPLLLGVVLAAYGLPRTLLLVVGGHASDRWRPWTVMMAADVGRAVAVAALAVVALSGPASAAVLAPIAAVLGAGEGLFLPGSFSIVPSLLPGDDLQAGNALTSSGTQLATLVGPALGGVCVAVIGAPAAFGVDTVSFLLSAVSLAGVRRAQTLPPEPVTVQVADPVADPVAVPWAAPAGPTQAPAGPTQAPAGLTQAPAGPTVRQLVATEPVLIILLTTTLAANLGSGGLGEVALPDLARTSLHLGAAGYGGLIATFGGGALIGTLVAAQSRVLRRPAVVGSLAFLGAAGCAAAVPYLGSAVAGGGALLGYGALTGFGNVVTITAVQRWAPAALMGRLMSLVLLASFGIFPVSVLLGGLIVRAFGPAAFFPLASAALALAVGAALTTRRWRAFGAVPAAAPEPVR